jgi:tRNA-splicing ligase RtcB (3'-phosphate/5'-hydroxy nucleic acid ligase)
MRGPASAPPVTLEDNESMKIFGPAEERVQAQLARCQAIEDDAPAVLCADNHLGYSMPIGGVIGYADHVSPSAVGYDIACGNMAVRTDAFARDIDITAVMDDVWKAISFGVGRRNAERVNDPVIDAVGGSPIGFQRSLKDLAAAQLGTVGSGNHYVDLFEDEQDGSLWVGVHFGSRGLGHKTATWALEQAGAASDAMDAPPVVIPLASALGEDYIAGMEIAGQYAYAGRRWVVDRVLRIIGARAVDTVHNHHNFAWRETHQGRDLWVHRKGATPAFAGQRGFVGGTMSESAVILEGLESPQSADALYSTVHGAGRIMSRRQAAGKFKGWGAKRVRLAPGAVDYDAVRADIAAKGIELRGGGADEAPECYKRLSDVLGYHQGTIRVLHVLKPIGVAMAGPDVADPYKD